MGIGLQVEPADEGLVGGELGLELAQIKDLSGGDPVLLHQVVLELNVLTHEIKSAVFEVIQPHASIVR